MCLTDRIFMCSKNKDGAEQILDAAQRPEEKERKREKMILHSRYCTKNHLFWGTSFPLRGFPNRIRFRGQGRGVIEHLSAQTSAFLALEDGTVFHGFSDDPEGMYGGEVIFNTSMGGYQEICTDPSYASQIVIFTKPHIGNTGTNEEDNESSRCWLSGIVVRERATRTSSWRSTQDFPSFWDAIRYPLCMELIPESWLIL